MARVAFNRNSRSDDLLARKMDIWKVFKYIDYIDMLTMALGTLGSIADGLSVPATWIIWGRLSNTLGYGSSQKNGEFITKMNMGVMHIVFVAAAVWIAAFIEAFFWTRTGERQASRLRRKYLRAVLRQDAQFFDTRGISTAEVVNAVTNDTLLIQDVLTEKTPFFIKNVTTFIGSYAVSFYLSWKLTLVAFPLVTLLITPAFIYGKILMRLARDTHAQNNRASTIVEQALSSIRTVYSFVGEDSLINKYSSVLDTIVKQGLKQGLAKGLVIGNNGFTFVIWAFMAWRGSGLVISHAVSPGIVLAIGLLITHGGMALAMALPNLKYFSEAAIAAFHISEMIDRVPEIDQAEQAGNVLEKVYGEIQFRNVQFTYPSRPDTRIFRNFSLIVPAGQTMALVGASGSGKSTAILLLERFYDPTAGEILLDRVNIQDLQLKWLRNQIGLVSQEPTLFATSIRENILFGKENATMDEITTAAMAANAHNFINQLPQGYDTQVGERGVQMSGGQKQRIAIARTLLKNPPIMLLDEATSALDAESERIVQDALDKASTGRTTIIVAHHLSIVKAVDIIAVVQDGCVIESGGHLELIQNPNGKYASLIHLQQQTIKKQTIDNNTSIPILRGSRWDLENMSDILDEHGSSFSTLEKEEKVKVSDKTRSPSFCLMFAMNSPEWKNAVVGCLGAIGYGALNPSYSITVASMLSVLFLDNHDEIRGKIRSYCIIFVALTVWSFLANVIEHYNFAVMGEFLTRRVRMKMLSKILTFEVGWFDMKENSSGAVCSSLSKEANMMRSLVGDRLSLMVESLSAVVIACIVSLVVSWRFAIVLIATQPVQIYCHYTKRVLLKQLSRKSSKAQNQSSQVATECVVNHRTIAAFCGEERILRLFESTQKEPHKEIKRQSWYAGLVLGTCEFIHTSQGALGFWYGGKLRHQGYLSFHAFLTCIGIMGRIGRIIADAGSMTSDIAKGADAVKSIFVILDRNSSINAEDIGGFKPDKIDGNVELRNVDFSYPARPNVIVLRDFCLEIKAGSSVALVGKSGCGKSTIIELLERFYDPIKGLVLIDDKDIKAFNMRYLRHFIGLVGQEPSLFAGSIRDNILYGKEDATEAEVIEAAMAANAHGFICHLENGYDTNTGDRGLQLSGGQKQRIAIARAIIKNPSILLLDEATSALDLQSEKMVQEALDRVMVGRTSIVIAHRLSTIQNSDCIAVIEDGKIVEQGSHPVLMSKGEKSEYFRLIKLQERNNSISS
ncbi:hypothetical protein SUGI_1456730 [Cryptomeria japonica]|uniref:Uncharacterized protein n=2 Tax=Cryptomeria japonica TaxID=3369 RepID=A0AAD3NRW9_CRYJA|nr:hypothetical protein SUGI_1456730 [Cryptomeria japonica]